MSSVVKISGVVRPSHWIDTQFFVVPTTVPASSLVFTRSPSASRFAWALVIGKPLPSCAEPAPLQPSVSTRHRNLDQLGDREGQDRNRSLLAFLARSHLPCLATSDTNTPSLSLCWTCNSALPTTVTFHPVASEIQVFLSAERLAIRRSLNVMKVPSRVFRNHRMPNPYRPNLVPVSVPDRCTADSHSACNMRTETLQRSQGSRDRSHSTSLAHIPVERNDYAFTIVQLDSDLDASIGRNFPSVFEGHPGSSLQRARCDLYGVELDEKGIAFPCAPQRPNAIAADQMAAQSPRHLVPGCSISW
jgi:hypothetical protein